MSLCCTNVVKHELIISSLATKDGQPQINIVYSHEKDNSYHDHLMVIYFPQPIILEPVERD